MAATYVTYRDGTVVAYGPERDASRPGLWIASAWTAHPLKDPDNAQHIKHLCADAERAELGKALAGWAEGRR